MKYIDSTLFLYAFLTQGPKSARAADLLRTLSAGEWEAVTSSLTLDEVVHKLSKVAGRQAAVEQGQRILSLPGLRLHAVGRSEITSALELFAGSPRLGARDAVHAAVALAAGASAIVSDDGDFDYVKGIPRETLG